MGIKQAVGEMVGGVVHAVKEQLKEWKPQRPKQYVTAAVLASIAPAILLVKLMNDKLNQVRRDFDERGKQAADFSEKAAARQSLDAKALDLLNGVKHDEPSLYCSRAATARKEQRILGAAIPLQEREVINATRKASEALTTELRPAYLDLLRQQLEAVESLATIERELQLLVGEVQEAGFLLTMQVPTYLATYVGDEGRSGRLHLLRREYREAFGIEQGNDSEGN